MNHIQFIQNQTNIAPKSIEATIKLLSEDCTIPFISRYRKDQTGNLDEVQIEAISKLNKQFDEIVKRKERNGPCRFCGENSKHFRKDCPAWGKGMSEMRQDESLPRRLRVTEEKSGLHIPKRRR